MEEDLKNYFYDIEKGGLSLKKLQEYAKEKKYKLKDVKSWYNKQKSNQIFQQNKNKIYHSIYARQNYEYQADLLFFESLKTYNGGVIGLLTCIDITSRKGYVEPIKNKTAPEVLRAFKVMYEKMDEINTLTVDGGKEFFSDFKKFMEENKITFYQINTENNKNTMSKIERFNRTVRSAINKYLKVYKTNKYVDIVQNLNNTYNNSKHSTTGLKPNETTDEQMQHIRHMDYFKNINAFSQFNKFKLGDKVRLLKKKERFEKGTTANYTSGIYEIIKIDGLSFYVKNTKNDNELKTPYKFYMLKLVEQSEEPNIVKSDNYKSNKEIKQDVKLKRNMRQHISVGHEGKIDENDKVVLKERLQPTNEKRVRRQPQRYQ